MIDIGQRIKDELQRQDRTAYWLAQKLGINRSVLYRNLDKTSIDTALLQRIGMILHHNFFSYFSEEEGEKPRPA